VHRPLVEEPQDRETQITATCHEVHRKAIPRIDI
jgi:hypothetical protein